MTPVHLTGLLRRRDAREAATVAQLLPRHVELTRAEPGRVSFAVTRGEDPLEWAVDEVFEDAEAFGRHQDRVRDNAWGRATARIVREYEVTGI